MKESSQQKSVRFRNAAGRVAVLFLSVWAGIAAGQGRDQLHKMLAKLDPPVAIDPVRGDRSRGKMEFPDGSKIVSLQLASRTLVIKEADGRERRVVFDYGSYPTTINVMHAGPDGKIYGSSDHPSFMFVYDPGKDELMFYPGEKINFKALKTQGPYIFGGHYSGGLFWLLDTSKPITLAPVSCTPGKAVTPAPPAPDAAPNPRNLGKFQPNINIPRGAFAHPDGQHIMIFGQPGYGFVGGGMVIYNLETKTITQLHHQQLLRDYSTMAVAALPDGSLLCGTSPKGGHGTAAVHNRAQLYVLDWKTKTVVWQSGPLDGVSDILTLLAGPDGRYYYVTDAGVFVALKVELRGVKPGVTDVLDKKTEPAGLLADPEQARRIDVAMETERRLDLSAHGSHTLTSAMTIGPDGKIYLALSKGMVRITPGTYEVEPLLTPPGGISAGIGIVSGRLYFASAGHLKSIAIPPSGKRADPEAIVNHGAPVTSSENRGMTAAVDGGGKRVVLVWLMNGGTDQVLAIDAETGETRRIPVEPFAGDNAFSVWHSTRDRFYSHFGRHFYEFDLKTLKFSFAAPISGRCAMSMHEDSKGVIWAALYSGAGLISFNPETRELKDHGAMNSEGWGQYPSYMAVDDAGWVYIGIGNTLGQLVGYNPATGERRAYVRQGARAQGVGHPFAATDGKVYATAPGWSPHELFAGEATPLQAVPQREQARQAGDYDPKKGDYFMPAAVFRNWLYVDKGAETIVGQLMEGGMSNQPAVAWAPTALPAEADRWLWKNDLKDRFELLLRARSGFAPGTLRITLNERSLFEAASPFAREGSSLLRLPIPPDVLREKENTLKIGFALAEQSDKKLELSAGRQEDVDPMTLYYAVFKRVGKP